MLLQVWVKPIRFESILSKPDDVKLYSQQGVYLRIGHRYDRMRGSHSGMGSETVKPADKPLLDWPYIVSLLSFHEQSHEQARQDGIDYKSAMEHDRLTLAQLGQLFGHCMGYIEHFKLQASQSTLLGTRRP